MPFGLLPLLLEMYVCRSGWGRLATAPFCIESKNSSLLLSFDLLLSEHVRSSSYCILQSAHILHIPDVIEIKEKCKNEGVRARTPVGKAGMAWKSDDLYKFINAPLGAETSRAKRERRLVSCFNYVSPSLASNTFISLFLIWFICIVQT